MLVFISSPKAYASRHYERVFTGQNGSSTVTVDVADKIVFAITVTSGYDFFCFTPESIIQGEVQYYITEFPSEPTDIKITWQNFDGCNDIYAGITAIGTMSIFPSSFNIWDSFRIYCGIWESDDYFDVAADSSGTTSSTTTTEIQTLTTTTSVQVQTTTTSIQAPTTTTTITPSTTTTVLMATTTTTAAVTTTISSTTTTVKGICPATNLLGERSPQLSALYALRDMILSGMPQGRNYIASYYSNATEIADIFTSHPELKEWIRSLIMKLLPAINDLIAGRKATIQDSTVQKGLMVIDNFSSHASPALQQDLRQIKQDIQSGIIFNAFKVEIQK